MFIDWITISQNHSHDIANLTAGRVLCLSSDGEIEWLTDKHYQHEGSFDTRIMVRAVANTLSVSGNVGAWSRPDNVFGYDFVQTLAKLNNILEGLGFPPFSNGRNYFRRRGNTEKYDFVWTGATLSRLDLTQNFETGSQHNAGLYINHLSGLKPTRMRTTVHGNADTISTVYSGEKSKFRTAIVYNKAEEFKKRKSKHLKNNDPYYHELLEYLENEGVIRYELRLKQRFLTQNRLRFLGDIMSNPQQLELVFKKELEQTIKNIEVGNIEHLSQPALLTYFSWEKGLNIQQNRSRSTFYNHRREILDVIGVDISNPYTSVSVQAPLKVKVLEVYPARKPNNYFLPTIGVN